MHNKKKRAFSLVELTITVVIIGVLTALAIPRIIDVQAKARFNTLKLSGKSIGKALTQLKTLGIDDDGDGVFEAISLIDLTRVDGIFAQIDANSSGLESVLITIDTSIEIYLESDSGIVRLDSDQYFALTDSRTYDVTNGDDSRDPDMFYFNIDGSYIGDAGKALAAVAAIPGNNPASILKSGEIKVVQLAFNEESTYPAAKH